MTATPAPATTTQEGALRAAPPRPDRAEASVSADDPDLAADADVVEVNAADDVAGIDAVAIYRSELSWLWSVLARLRVPESDLEDAAHDVFIVLHRRLEDWDRTRPLRPWLFGIAFRVATARKRRAFRRREQHMPEHFQVEDPAAAVDEQVAARRQQEKAKHLVGVGLDALDDDKRAIFVLHELEGIAIVDCVDALGAPLNTLYSRLRLARARFATAVRAAQAALDQTNATPMVGTGGAHAR